MVFYFVLQNDLSEITGQDAHKANDFLFQVL